MQEAAARGPTPQDLSRNPQGWPEDTRARASPHAGPHCFLRAGEEERMVLGCPSLLGEGPEGPPHSRGHM